MSNPIGGSRPATSDTTSGLPAPSSPQGRVAPGAPSRPRANTHQPDSGRDSPRRTRADTRISDVASIAQAASVAAAQQEAARRFNANVNYLLGAPFDADGRLADPSGFISAAICVVSDPLVDTRLADIDAALKALWIPANLRRVQDTAKLEALRVAIAGSNVSVGGGPLIDELARRVAQVAPPKSAPQAADVLAALRGAKTPKDFARAFTTIHGAAGGGAAAGPKHQDERDQAQVALVNQLVQVIRSLPPAERERLSAVMRSPVMMEVRAALEHIQRSPVVLAYPMLQGDLKFVASVLDAVQRNAAESSSSGDASGRSFTGLAALSDDAKTMLEGCGIAIGKGGTLIVKSGVANWEVQRVFEESLRGMSADMGKASTKDTALGDTYFVASAMLKDFNVVDFYAEARGVCVPLIDRGPRKAPLSEQQVLRAVQQLVEVLGPLQPDELLAVSRAGNLNLMHGILQVTGSPFIPVCCLPDGTPGQLLGQSTHVLRIRREGQEFIMAGEFRIDDAALFVPLGKTPRDGIPLARGHNHLRFSFEVAVKPGAGVRPVGLVEFAFDATPDAWSAEFGRSYPKPTSGSHVFLLDRRDEVFVEFKKFLSAEWSGENLDYVVEFDALMRKKDVDYAQAETLARKFAVHPSPFELNLPSGLQLQIARVLDDTRFPPHAKLEELLRLLAQARVEIENLVVRDSMGRFISKELEKGSIRTSTGSTEAAEDSPAPPSAGATGAMSGVAGEQSAGAVDPRARKQRQTATFLRTLGTPFLPANRVANVASLLTRQLNDKTVPEGSRLDVFKRDARAPMSQAEPVELAALQYNIDEVLDAQVRASPPVRAIREELVKELAARGIVSFDVKSVLIGGIHLAPPDSVWLPTVVNWLESGVVHPGAVERALTRMEPEKLRVLASSEGQVAPLAVNALAALDQLAVRHEKLASTFLAAARALNWSAQRAGDDHDTDKFAGQVAVAAAAYADYQGLRILEEIKTTRLTKQVDFLRDEVANRLGALLHDGEFRKQGAANDFRVSLETLGVDVPLPPPAEARLDTPTDDEPPPAHLWLSDDETPPPPRSPGDEKMPPPPESPDHDVPPPPAEDSASGDERNSPANVRDRR